MDIMANSGGPSRAECDRFNNGSGPSPSWWFQAGGERVRRWWEPLIAPALVFGFVIVCGMAVRFL